MRTFLTALVLLIGVTCFGQVTPQYYIERYPNGVVAPIFQWGVGIDSQIFQSLLLLDSFNVSKPPYGKIKNIYIRTGGVSSQMHNWKGCKATKVVMSLGHSSLQNLDTTIHPIKTLTQLATLDTLTTDTVKGGWIKIAVGPEVSFYIDTTKNLVFEYALDTGGIARLPQGSPSGCAFLASRFTGTGSKQYMLYSYKSSSAVASKYNLFSDFGFDLYPNPADVSTMQNLTDLRIYPNPSSGRFIISMAAERAVKEAQLTVSDMAGRVVWRQQYQNIDENFYQDIDMSAYPKGIYLAELRADGERLTKKLVVH